MRRVVSTLKTGPSARSFAESVFDGSARGEYRERDLRLLRALGDESRLRDDELDAFDDMLDRLVRRGQIELTEAQREWAEAVAERHELDFDDPAERNANVPRGREVETPEALSAASVRKALEAMRNRRGRTAG